MARLDIPEYQKQRPIVQMAPLIDIVFLTLVFFMTLSIFSQQEAELNISVPKAKSSDQALRSPGEIIINVTKGGQIVVNQKPLSVEQLEVMLGRVATLFPDQSVIVRADEQTLHKYVVAVLDACAKVDIWNISFSTIKEQ
ncbi:MAG: biopolymer transporter ExbD [Candidatus Omnitrophica bacterium]|nr:biopolymer transporter ExbD [Candidatus Omnitrophota bacterium]MCA9405856.1 biopolymer transporter ExbD [Candidatus Omnitrophota bacterium]